jgi:hypothetical protein
MLELTEIQKRCNELYDAFVRSGITMQQYKDYLKSTPKQEPLSMSRKTVSLRYCNAKIHQMNDAKFLIEIPCGEEKILLTEDDLCLILDGIDIERGATQKPVENDDCNLEQCNDNNLGIKRQIHYPPSDTMGAGNYTHGKTTMFNIKELKQTPEAIQIGQNCTLHGFPDQKLVILGIITGNPHSSIFDPEYKEYISIPYGEAKEKNARIEIAIMNKDGYITTKHISIYALTF